MVRRAALPIALALAAPLLVVLAMRHGYDPVEAEAIAGAALHWRFCAAIAAEVASLSRPSSG